MIELVCKEMIYVLAPLWFISIISWINVFRISHAALPRIKEHQPQLYRKIVPAGKKSWLERGWYSPEDPFMQLRMYRAIYRGKADKVLTHISWRIFVWSLRIFISSVVALILSFILLIIFCMQLI